MKRKCLFTAAVVLLFMNACVQKNEIPVELGKWYKADAAGKTMFFNFSSIDGASANGQYYDTGSGCVSSPETVTVTFARRKTQIVNDRTQEKTKVSRLKPEEYIPMPFEPSDTSLYRLPKYSPIITNDLKYGSVQGYWTSLPGVESDVMKLVSQGVLKSFNRKELDLTMDIARPKDKEGLSPLIVFIHGGAFYVGDKQEPAYVDFKRHFAELGYVTASINYRMGFHIGKSDIERAGYMAAQDAHAAVRWLVHNASEYGIDKNRIFLAGSSAGSITALNATFMTDRFRPESTRGKDKLLRDQDDLGRIDRSGNDLKDEFHITAIANMWGAVSDLDMLAESETDIVSFHGDVDEVVPYADGLPFKMAGEKVAKALSEPMHGSVSISAREKSLGRKAIMYPYPGRGHAFNTTGKDKAPNSLHYEIRGRISDFFYRELVPLQAKVVDLGDGWYSVEGSDLSDVSWQADGGFILDTKSDKVRILWREDAPARTVRATGNQSYGTSFLTSAKVSFDGKIN